MFEINGLSKQSLEIYGQGTEMKVSLNSEQHLMAVVNLNIPVVEIFTGHGPKRILRPPN